MLCKSIFLSLRLLGRPLSKMAFRVALRRLGEQKHPFLYSEKFNCLGLVVLKVLQVLFYTSRLVGCFIRCQKVKNLLVCMQATDHFSIFWIFPAIPFSRIKMKISLFDNRDFYLLEFHHYALLHENYIFFFIPSRSFKVKFMLTK